LAPEGVERRLAAILSADAVGYSRLMAEDEAATIRTLTAYREQATTLVQEHRGRVVDFTGDNFLAEFPTALEAVQAAVEIQRALKARNADLLAERRMQFRMGVHLGDVAVEGERIYGDGVNIAARLEGLAEPGGICISGEVHGQVRQKLDLECENLGEQALKNIPHPVRVHRLQPQLESPSVAPNLPGMDELTVPGFSGRPAIAVLPFDNLSADPEQEYFADGIVEDLITRLAACRTFPVIARNSTFTYRNQAVDVKVVGRELGARYVVEGSVRRAGNRVRIGAQLIDASTGLHIWAEIYDRELRDIFELQDELTRIICGSIQPQLGAAERKRAIRSSPRSFEAWDYVQRGLWHSWQGTKDDLASARSLANKALQLDPRFAPAFTVLAGTYAVEGLKGWAASTTESFQQAIQAAETSVALDDEDPEGHRILGAIYTRVGQLDRAISEGQRAVELDPSFAHGHWALGLALAISGRTEEGLAALTTAMRLSPRDPLIAGLQENIAAVNLIAGHYDAAVTYAEKSLQRSRHENTAAIHLAVGYAHLGQRERALSALTEARRQLPDLTLRGVERTFSRMGMDPLFIKRYIDGLRKAGLKE